MRSIVSLFATLGAVVLAGLPVFLSFLWAYLSSFPAQLLRRGLGLTGGQALMGWGAVFVLGMVVGIWVISRPVTRDWFARADRALARLQ